MPDESLGPSDYAAGRHNTAQYDTAIAFAKKMNSEPPFWPNCIFWFDRFTLGFKCCLPTLQNVKIDLSLQNLGVIVGL